MRFDDSGKISMKSVVYESYKNLKSLFSEMTNHHVLYLDDW